MFNRLVRSATLGALLANSAIAQGTFVPTLPASSADECLKVASDLAAMADDNKLSNEDLDTIEELLTKMEGHCNAEQFGEAHTVAKEIEKVIKTKL
jgi:hypothetical protein